MAEMTMPGGGFVEPTANDRLKRTWGNWFWLGLLLATALHFVTMAFFPDMEATDVSYTAEEIQQVDVTQEFEIPPPPEQIARPAVPVLSTNVEISEDITIGEVTFEDNPVANLPPPPTGQSVSGVEDQPTFTPYEVKPELRNRSEFGRLLERRYPPMLKDAGIGGTVVLWVFIDEQGMVKNTRVTQGSGYEQLDQVAQEVMREARFSPALNRDQKVPVWIQLPVTFQTR